MKLSRLAEFVCLGLVLVYQGCKTSSGTGGSIRRPPAVYKGLINANTVCYLNSSLQVLFRLKPLKALVDSCAARQLKREVLNPDGTSMCTALKNVFAELADLSNTAEPADARPVWSLLDQKKFPVGQQHDSHEVLLAIHAMLVAEMATVDLADDLNALFKGVTESSVTWHDPVEALESRSSGEEVETYHSDKEEDFHVLMLPMAGAVLEAQRLKKISLSVEDLHDAFDEVQLLEGPNRYHTDEGALVDAERHTWISQWPSILIVSLGRFASDPIRKIDKAVSFQDTLDLTHFDAPGKYKLHGIVVHQGSSDSGHYYSFVDIKDPTSSGTGKGVYKFDDQLTSEVSAFDMYQDNFGFAIRGDDPRELLKDGSRHVAYQLYYVLESFDQATYMNTLAMKDKVFLETPAPPE